MTLKSVHFNRHSGNPAYRFHVYLSFPFPKSLEMSWKFKVIKLLLKYSKNLKRKTIFVEGIVYSIYWAIQWILVLNTFDDAKLLEWWWWCEILSFFVCLCTKTLFQFADQIKNRDFIGRSAIEPKKIKMTTDDFTDFTQLDSKPKFWQVFSFERSETDETTRIKIIRIIFILLTNKNIFAFVFVFIRIRLVG